MENFREYRDDIKNTYDQIKEFDSEMAKEYLDKKQKTPEYKAARESKIEDFKSKPKESRENIEELRRELSTAISKYQQNGLTVYLSKFLSSHGPQEAIELNGHVMRDVREIVSGELSLILREDQPEKAMSIVSLFKKVGAFREEYIEDYLEKALSTLGIRDREHGEDNLNPDTIHPKVQGLRKKLEELFQ
jgi:predicted RNase H-like nuclease (RuvC/YqgF family)